MNFSILVILMSGLASHASCIAHDTDEEITQINLARYNDRISAGEAAELKFKVLSEQEILKDNVRLERIEAMGYNPNIETISLLNWGIGKQGLEKLAMSLAYREAYEQAKPIRQIDLRGNLVSGNDVLDFLSHLDDGIVVAAHQNLEENPPYFINFERHSIPEGTRNVYEDNHYIGEHVFYAPQEQVTLLLPVFRTEQEQTNFLEAVYNQAPNIMEKFTIIFQEG